MFASTRPVTIAPAAAARRRQSAAIDDAFNYALAAEPAPAPIDPAMDMVFDMDAYDAYPSATSAWAPHPESMSPAAAAQYDFFAQPLSPKDAYYASSTAYGAPDMSSMMHDDGLGAVLHESALSPATSSPIAIPDAPRSLASFVSYTDYNASPLFADAASFSPAAFSPGSFSPESDFLALHSPTSPPMRAFPELPAPAHGAHPQYGTPTEALSALTISPHDTTSLPFAPASWQTPAWAHQPMLAPPAEPAPVSGLALSHFGSPPVSPMDGSYAARSFAPGDAFPVRRSRARAASHSLSFQPSSSAPGAMSSMRASGMARAFSDQAAPPVAPSRRRGSTASRGGSEEALVATPPPGARADSPAGASGEQPAENAPQKSMLRPPKLAPSAWQLYFTDWIQKHQASSTKKLNVAQAAKEAGAEYHALPQAEKEPYKQRSLLAKAAREREMQTYMKSLTPDDVKRENAFRTAQRKAGKSRKSNIRDVNAPRKPLSAYFMFLSKIRSDPELVAEVFGDETETTKQSVLAAAKWRSMTDEQRKPFLAQAEQEKIRYEEALRVYNAGLDGSSAAPSFASGSINFSILSGSPIDGASIPKAFKAEPKLEPSDGFGFFIMDPAAHRS